MDHSFALEEKKKKEGLIIGVVGTLGASDDYAASEREN
jgi:hypothetical protein